MIQPGNLVKNSRGSIGIPKGSLALVVREVETFTGHEKDGDAWRLLEVKFDQFEGTGVHHSVDLRRYYARDLELVNG